MRFPNASRGVSKLIVSQIFNIIASAVMFISGFINFDMGNRSELTSENLAVVLSAFAILIVASGLEILAFVQQVIGLNQARRDEPVFKTALIFSFVGVFTTLLSVFINGLICSIIVGIGELATLLVSVYTLLGFNIISHKLENERVEKSSKITLLVVSAVFSFAVLDRVICMLTPGLKNTLDTICSALDIIGFVIFLTFLIQAKKMLSEEKQSS